MGVTFYQPQRAVSGPAYSRWYKFLATVVALVLVVQGVGVVLRFPLLQEAGLPVRMLLLGAVAMLALSYYWFLRSTITIDEHGIVQTWMFDRQVAWEDVRSAKMLGIPWAGWLFPPRLMVRTGNAFATFNGGSDEVLQEFARIALAYQMRRGGFLPPGS